MSMPDPAAVERFIEKAQASPVFTTDEVEALKEIALAYRGLEAFGRVAGVVRKVLAYVGWMIAVYLAVKYAVAEWVRGGLR